MNINYTFPPLHLGQRVLIGKTWSLQLEDRSLQPSANQLVLEDARSKAVHTAYLSIHFYIRQLHALHLFQ